MKWISVKDKLPDAYKRVLVRNGSGFVSIAYHNGNFWKEDSGYLIDNAITDAYKIVKWMEFPEEEI